MTIHWHYRLESGFGDVEIILLQHLISPPVICEVRFARSLVFCVVLCRSLFVLVFFSIFYWKLWGMSFFAFMNFDYPSVSSNSSCKLTGQKKRLWNMVVSKVWRYDRSNYKSHYTENIIWNLLKTGGGVNWLPFVVLLLDHTNTSIGKYLM